jgi:ABC-2 type transport system permease protein
VANSGHGAPGNWREAGVLHLLGPKWRIARRRMKEDSGIARTVTLATVGGLFWLVLFGLVYRMLGYFRATPGIGDLLAMKLLGLILLAFLSILLLSNIITALSSFFLARDLELLAAAPVDGLRVYSARFIETIVNSSWMMVLVLIPILTAYGVAYRAGFAFVAVTAFALACYLVLPAVIGTVLTQVLVNVFPARRARDLLALMALLGGAAMIAMFRLLKPEQLARPEGFANLVDFIGALRTPQSIWLPSEWAAQAMLAPLNVGDRPGDYFPLLLLASTAAAFLVCGAWVHGRLFIEGFSRSQEGAEQKGQEDGAGRGRIENWLAGVGVTGRSLVAKDIRTFFRDTTQWSQLVLLAVLVVIYIYNIKVLPIFTGEEVGFFLINVISFLNLGLAGFVLAAIAARFLFPAVSLEGRTLWLLKSSPLDLRQLLWSKYWVGVAPLMVLALALTVGTNIILRVTPFVMALSVATIILMTLAISSMALGFGAIFPKFDTENTAEIPTSFGGLVFMMTATSYLGIVVMLEAWPVYAILRARQAGEAVSRGQITFLMLSLIAVLVLSAIATYIPFRTAVRRVEGLDE